VTQPADVDDSAWAGRRAGVMLDPSVIQLNAGTCSPDKPLGARCTDDGSDNVDSECQSGWCANGFCCESECHGTCETCRFADWPGVCLTAPTGEDPHDLCGFNRTCNGPERDGLCGLDDTATCAFDYECASGQCDNGKCCHKACDGVCERCTADGMGCELVPDGLDDNATCPTPPPCSAGRCRDALGEPCAEPGE